MEVQRKEQELMQMQVRLYEDPIGRKPRGPTVEAIRKPIGL